MTPITRTTPAHELPQFLTIHEAGRLLGIGRSSAYQLGREIGVKVGRLVRIPRERLLSLTAAK